MKIGDEKNTLATYKLESNNNFNFKDSKMFLKLNKQHKNSVEFNHIFSYNAINQRPEFINLCLHLVKFYATPGLN